MATTTGNPGQSKCAFCKRWTGDANLTNQGIGRGLIRFEISARGTCTASGNHIQKSAVDGSGCRNYEISPEANRYV